MLCYNATQGIVTSDQNEKLAEEIFRILSMVCGFLVLHRHGDRIHRACDYFSLSQIIQSISSLNLSPAKKVFKIFIEILSGSNLTASFLNVYSVVEN